MIKIMYKFFSKINIYENTKECKKDKEEI